MTFNELVREGAARLTDAGVPDPMIDARRLLDGLASGSLGLIGRDEVAPDVVEAYHARISQRRLHRPVSHILGWREFWGRRFAVGPDVLDPRPETETLIAAALAGPQPQRILDLGTGSGAILLTLLAEWEQADGVGTDISTNALKMAARNAHQFGISRVEWVASDWLTQVCGTFDLIVSNPPYIAAEEMAGLSRSVREHEPHLALTPGGDGLDPYRTIARQIRPYLNQPARILMEIGPTQGQQVSDFFASIGPSVVHKDLDGRDRVVEIAVLA